MCGEQLNHCNLLLLPLLLQTGVYSNTVVLQHHSVVMTKADKIYKVKCTYDMSSKNITFGMMPIRDPEMIHINSSPEAPPPRIRILDTRQREVETVRIGDRLNFRIEIPEDSKREKQRERGSDVLLTVSSILQLPTASSPAPASPWPRMHAPASRSSTTMAAPQIQPSSPVSQPTAMHCNRPTRHSASPKATASSSSAMSSTAWDPVSLLFANGTWNPLSLWAEGVVVLSRGEVDPTTS